MTLGTKLRVEKTHFHVPRISVKSERNVIGKILAMGKNLGDFESVWNEESKAYKLKQKSVTSKIVK